MIAKILLVVAFVAVVCVVFMVRAWRAGVALGMAITAQALADGAVVRSVVLFSVLVYELVGPALTKRAWLAAGEIQPEGRTSARTKNA